MRLTQLPQPRRAKDVHQLFYAGSPLAPDQVDPACRTKNLFVDLVLSHYNSLCFFIMEEPDLAFPDVARLLKTTKQEGKVMSTVLTHVGQWLNCQPFRANERFRQKPALRDDFLPALRQRYGRTDADTQSLHLQRTVLDYVREQMNGFTDSRVASYLSHLPLDQPLGYLERFESEPWCSLLRLVYNITGPHFDIAVMQHFHLHNPCMLPREPSTAIPQGLCHALPRIAEISHNPALQGDDASESFRRLVRPVVIQWALERCQQGVAQPDEAWSPSTLQHIQEDLKRFQSLAPPTSPPARPHVNGTSASTTPVHGTVEAKCGPPAMPRVSSSQSCSEATMVDMCTTADNPRSSDDPRPPSSGIANGANSNPPSSGAVRPPTDLFDPATLVPDFIRAPIRRGGQAWRRKPGVQRST